MKYTDLPGLALDHDAIFPVSGPELQQITQLAGVSRKTDLHGNKRVTKIITQS
jgi:hypothetical protein